MPLPFLDDLLVSSKNALADAGECLAPPISQFRDQPVDTFYQTKGQKHSYDELTAPLSALLLAWRARSSAVPAEAEADRSRGAYTTRSAQFNNEYLPLPVGCIFIDRAFWRSCI